MNGARGPGPLAYAIVMLLLAGYFFWILDRMAAFSSHGFRRLDKIAVGFGIVILVLVVTALIGRAGHRRGRHHDS